MSNTEIIKFWYRFSDIKQFNNIQNIDAYSDQLFINPTVKIIELLAQVDYYIENNLDNFSIEYVTYFLDDKKEDCIYVQYSLYNASIKSRFKPGYYIFPIINGSGKYLGASGKVYIYVGEDLIRNFVLEIIY
jgi:hypothetical protein